MVHIDIPAVAAAWAPTVQLLARLYVAGDLALLGVRSPQDHLLLRKLGDADHEEAVSVRSNIPRRDGEPGTYRPNYRCFYCTPPFPPVSLGSGKMCELAYVVPLVLLLPTKKVLPADHTRLY